MDTQQTKEGEKEGCCAKGQCGCCVGKALVALLVIAGTFTGGYFCGKSCALKHEAPAAAAPK